MIHKVKSFLRTLVLHNRIGVGLSRAASTSALRRIDPRVPSTWEFSGFSQNGEDGIVDFLSRLVRNPNRYFVEIGSSDGLENNTAWLAYARKYNGLMVEGDPRKHSRSRVVASLFNLGVECLLLHLRASNVQLLKEKSHHLDADVFSLDVDGVDYHLAHEIMKAGFRPKIFVVEYNSAFGPDASLTVPYADDFDFRTADRGYLYYGVSISGWKKFFLRHGYQFVTVEQNGVNAFFIDPQAFDSDFVAGLRGIDFRENFNQRRKWNGGWEKQFEMIKAKDFISI